MISDHHVGQGDLSPSIVATLKDETGAPLPLDGYDSITFRMRLMDKSRPAIVGGAAMVATVDGGGVGDVQHDWASGETEVPGLYEVEWRGVKAGRPETFSNNNKSTLWIAPRV